MTTQQNLYNVFKIPASFLVANNCNIENYSISQGLKDGNVVAIGDNIIFQQLRYLHKDYRKHTTVFNYVQKLRKNEHAYKKQGKYKEAHILNRYITDILFVKDIVNVILDQKKTDFNKFRTKGFYLNGVHYVYLCSGSGQIRRNTATFINEEYQQKIIKIINCGLDEKTSQFVLAKYSAYFALAFSSILWVRTPRVCVIKDFFHIVKDEPVDFICPDENGKSHIDKRIMDLELNCADGQGLIDPAFASLWAQDMNLSYTPSSFVARSCFIKGNLVPFDFREYAKLHNITTIRDKWGTEYNINEIDVLLSESQFKTHKYYSSWQDYLSYVEKGKIHWGVARYNRKEDDEYVLANYQYIQALTLSQEDIRNLIAPTVSWINQVCRGDLVYTLLYSFGTKRDDIEYNGVYGTAQTSAMKALIKNPEFLKDSYIQRKVYKNIAESINHSKIGKIWIRGNYQFMISDPVAQCQSALGLDPIGLLKKDEVYSEFWLKRKGKNCIIDCCRSPMIDFSEHNPVTVASSDDMEYWYKYISSGIIYNTYDTSTFRHSDSDFDGDLCMSSDNEYFIKGSHKEHNMITYEKGLAVPAKMTIPNITATVMKGFGTGVGGFSNTATIMYAMSAIFNKPETKEQYDIIVTRIKLLREIVGQEIDRIKGADKPVLPSEWKKFEKFDENDTPEEKIRKSKANALVVSKKPYFFRYLYPELNQKFKQFENSYNQISKDMFGIKFKKLLRKENKSEEEKSLVRRYQKYCPLITSACTMNNLCREFESIDFDIKFAKDVNDEKMPNVSMLPTYKEEFKDNESSEKFKIIRTMYQEYNTKKQIKHLTSILVNSDEIDEMTNDYKELRSTLYDLLINSLQETLISNSISGEEFLYYSYKLSKIYSSFNWGFVWEVLADQIIKYIPQSEQCFYPVLDPTGTYEYLGRRYSLKDITVKVSHTDLEEIEDLSIDTDPFHIEPDDQLFKEILNKVQPYEETEKGGNTQDGSNE